LYPESRDYARKTTPSADHHFTARLARRAFFLRRLIAEPAKAPG